MKHFIVISKIKNILIVLMGSSGCIHIFRYMYMCVCVCKNNKEKQVMNLRGSKGTGKELEGEKSRRNTVVIF